MGNVAIRTASVPQDFCFTSWQTAWPDLIALLTGELADVGNFVNIGNSIPSLANQDKPWIRSNSDGSIDKIYTFTSGVWVARHPLPAGVVTLFTGAEADIDTFDGGESGAITWNTGPVWARLTSITGRFPLDPGTLASAKIVAVGDIGGNEKVAIDVTEMPSHSHQVDDTEAGKFICEAIAHPDNTINRTGSLAYKLASLGATGGDPAAAHATKAHDNMPPYLGIFFLKRTARTHYRL